MKKHGEIVTMVAVLIICMVGSLHAQFYYGKYGPVSITEDSNRIILKFEITAGQDNRTELLAQLAGVLQLVL
ncbi:MAG: hypothetical protein AB1644_13855 [Candidatus Zixiibacteriota bacterium]